MMNEQTMLITKPMPRAKCYKHWVDDVLLSGNVQGASKKSGYRNISQLRTIFTANKPV